MSSVTKEKFERLLSSFARTHEDTFDTCWVDQLSGTNNESPGAEHLLFPVGSQLQLRGAGVTSIDSPFGLSYDRTALGMHGVLEEPYKP
jgi:hypothetical protein